ncbi:MAG: AAA family ATPase, partial [Okeania sp. SIO2H7]|nr:AAA family ATPase [Okeania sp. SIO2H7]
MLKRIYINNFKCLVNFELKLDGLSLFLGANGSGKSTVFEVLIKLQKFILGADLFEEDCRVQSLFEKSDLTRWETSLIQNFELDIEGNGGLYKYVLEIEHQGDYKPPRMRTEKLSFGDVTLFEFWIKTDDRGIPVGEAQLYNDDPTREGPFLPFFDWSRSGVSFVYERPDNQKLTWFKKRMANFFIVHLNPGLMNSESRQEEKHPNWKMSNYAAWYSYLSQASLGQIIKLTLELQNIIPGFDSLQNP